VATAHVLIPPVVVEVCVLMASVVAKDCVQMDWHRFERIWQPQPGCLHELDARHDTHQLYLYYLG
jgi:hypothetical protein